MTTGLYVPGADGNMRFKESAQQEERPILSYEEDTGRILLNFNMILLPKFRKLQDIITITNEGVVQGLILNSTPMGPVERRARELATREKKDG